MARKARPQHDPLERAIEAALGPGRFVADQACFSFVSDLEAVANDIGQLIQSAPARAVTLYEAFLAGCYEKAEEVDDSSGSFGMFVASLFCAWITARQAAGAAPEETAARLVAWMDDDPYGFCWKIEKDAAAALDRDGRAALARQVRACFDAQTASAGDASGRGREYSRLRWGEVLRALHVAQNDIAAYVALAEETGLTAQDCHAVATMLAARRQPEEALSWVERGIDMEAKAPHPSSVNHDLADLQRRLLKKLGRADEALAAAWAAYCAHPSKYSYADLMKFVPQAERAAWHEKAIAAAAGADLGSHIEILIQTKEIERLAELVGSSDDSALESVSHYTLEPTARRLERAHAGEAARLWRATGLRTVQAKKSQYYGAALEAFGRAKRCYERAGLQADWQRLVDQVRAEHHRKTGFMPGFEEVVSGSGRGQDPSFLERAKGRWARG